MKLVRRRSAFRGPFSGLANATLPPTRTSHGLLKERALGQVGAEYGFRLARRPEVIGRRRPEHSKRLGR